MKEYVEQMFAYYTGRLIQHFGKEAEGLESVTCLREKPKSLAQCFKVVTPRKLTVTAKVVIYPENFLKQYKLYGYDSQYILNSSIAYEACHEVAHFIRTVRALQHAKNLPQEEREDFIKEDLAKDMKHDEIWSRIMEKLGARRTLNWQPTTKMPWVFE